MRCGTAVVRVIDHGSDTRINRAQRRQQVANIDIGRPVIFREREMRGIAVVVQTGGVIRYSECQYTTPAVELPALNRAQRGGKAGISWPSGSAEASHCHHRPGPYSVSYATVLTCLRCK